MSNETPNELETAVPEAAAEDLSIEELDGLSGGLSIYSLGTVGCPISSVATFGP